MAPNQITSIVNIKFGHKWRLEDVLKDVGNPLKVNNPYIRFGDKAQFVRLVIIPGESEDDLVFPGQEPRVAKPDHPPTDEEKTAAEKYHYRLLFMGCFTGEQSDFIAEMVAHSPNLDMVFALCEGYEGVNSLYAYLKRHEYEAQIFYPTFLNESAQTVNGKITRWQEVEDILDRNLPNLEAAKTEIVSRSRVPSLPPLSLASKARSELVLTGLAVVGLVAVLVAVLGAITSAVPVLGALLSALLVGLVLWTLWPVLERIFVGVISALLRRPQPTIDPKSALIDEAQELEEFRRGEVYKTSMLTGREDIIAQNQFNLYLTFKGNWLARQIRLLRMQILMFGLVRSVLIQNTPGSLGGLSTVHFGHWLVIDGGRRLFFMTTYDGSWENYIADFVNKVYQILDVQLMNFIGFDGKNGTRNISAFRNWLRKVQIQSGVFYSAYPHATVRNISSARAIIEKYPTKASSQEEWNDWFALLSASKMKEESH